MSLYLPRTGFRNKAERLRSNQMHQPEAQVYGVLLLKKKSDNGNACVHSVTVQWALGKQG